MGPAGAAMILGRARSQVSLAISGGNAITDADTRTTAWYDGTTSQGFGSSTRSVANTPHMYLGVNIGRTAIIQRVKVWGPSDLWFEAANNSIRLSLWGHTAAPGSWSGSDYGGTQLYTTDLTSPSNGFSLDITSGITRSSFAYFWAVLRALAGANEIYMAEMQIWEEL